VSLVELRWQANFWPNFIFHHFLNGREDRCFLGDKRVGETNAVEKSDNVNIVAVTLLPGQFLLIK